MRISFGGYFLCSDPSASNMHDDPPAQLLGKSGSRMQQIVAGADYEGQECHDRGNQLLNLSFRAQKVFSTPQAAESYMLGYEADAHHPWKGTLIIYLDGSGAKMRVMHDALISVPSFDYEGVRVFATHTVQGPAFSAEMDQIALFFMAGNESLVTVPFTSPDANQAFTTSGTSLVPAASFTTDSHWTTSGTSLIPTGV